MTCFYLETSMLVAVYPTAAYSLLTVTKSQQPLAARLSLRPYVNRKLKRDQLRTTQHIKSFRYSQNQINRMYDWNITKSSSATRIESIKANSNAIPTTQLAGKPNSHRAVRRRSNYIISNGICDLDLKANSKDDESRGIS